MGHPKIWKRPECHTEYVHKIHILLNGACIQGLRSPSAWFYAYVYRGISYVLPHKYIRKQLPFFLADGRHDSRIYYIFSDSEPDMMGHGRYPMPKLGEELPSRGRPYLIPVKPAITRCDNRINVVLAF